MPFDVYDRSLELVQQLVAPAEALARRDGDLARQLRRAASSVTLNIAEGRRRAGRDRGHLWRVAAGSADEVRACMQLAAAWGHVPLAELAAPLATVDRVLAMLYRLTE